MREMRIDTQTADVLAHLKERGHITSLEAIKLFGATRLSAIIYRLRYRYGYDITTNMITVTNRRGKKVDVAQYELKEESR